MKLNFFLYRSKINSYGTHPIYCRIRIHSTLDEFSTGVFVEEKDWDKAKKRVKSSCRKHAILNDQLLRIELELNTLKNSLESSKSTLTAQMIKRAFKTKLDSPITFMDVARKYLAHLQSQIGSDGGITIGTFQGYKTQFNNLTSYLQKHHLTHCLCEEIRVKFAHNYLAYLKTATHHKSRTGLKHNTSVKFIALVKRILKYAKNQEIIEVNPLSDFSVKTTATPEPVYLDEVEVSLLEGYNFASPYLREVTDCYLFCCATGLGYRECYDFDYQKHIFVDPINNAWIRIERLKNRRYNQVCYIPLLSRAAAIIEKYPGGLPVPYNNEMNKALRQIFAMVGISKASNTHTARKTAANYWYDNHISEEDIADCLGNTVNVLRKHYLSKNNKLRRISEAFRQLRDFDKANR